MKTKITFLLVSLLIVFTGNLIGQVNAGDNTTICSGDTLVLDDATAPNDYSILWTSSGTGTFNNNTLVNPTYYPVYLETVVTLTITATFHGESESDSLELTIQALPTVDAGSNATICEDDSFTVFDATADNESSVNWTGGNGSWQNSTTLTPTYTPNASEYGESVTLTIEALPIGPCIVSATDGMKIFVQAAPAVDAGDDRTTSINTPIPLTGEEQNTRSIEWSDNSAGGSFVPNNSITTTYTPPRDYTDPIEIFIKGLALEPCTGFDEDNMFLSIQEGPVAEVGSNVTTCEETAIPILGEASNFSSVHWTTSGAGTFSLPDSVETTYTPSELDTGDTIQLTLFAYPVFPFPDTASADMKLFVQPQLIGVSAGGNLSTCEETAKLITGTATNFSSVLWTTSGTGTFSQPDELETNYTPDLGETDFVTLTLTANAINECDSVISKSMTLFIQPQLTGVSAGGDLSTCEETAKLITGTATNFSSVLWTSSGTGTFRPSDSLETNYTPDLGETGFVTLTLMANAINECDSVISKSMILFIQPQLTDVSAGDDLTTCEETTILITGSASNFSSVLWESDGDGTFDPDDEQQTTYTPAAEESGDIILTLTATAIAPCELSETKSMTLFIQPNPSASAGVELFTCRDEAIEISGSADNFTSLMWSGGQGTWENATKLNPTYTPKIDEPGTIQIKLTAQAIGPCLVADVSTTTINLWDLPTTQITGQETVCRNSKDILYVADVLADADYSWTVDQGTYVNVSEDTIRVNWNAEAETSGSVKLTTTFKSTGCSFEADAYNVEISQDNAPDLDAIVGKGSCGTNSNPVVLICSNPGLDYQWFKKDGDLMNNDTGQFYYLHKEERQAGGVFYVRATNKSNALCDNFSNEVDIKPSSKSIEIDSEFSIFPNPASNEISITLNTEKINNTQGLTMQFHTLTGEWIKTIPLDSFFKTINVSELKQGIYTLSLYDEWKMLNIKKLIIVE